MRTGIDSLKKGWEIFRPFHRHFAILIALNFLTQFVWQFAPFIMGKTVNAATSHADFSRIALLIGLMFATWVTGILLSRVRSLYQEQTSSTQSSSI